MGRKFKITKLHETAGKQTVGHVEISKRTGWSKQKTNTYMYFNNSLKNLEKIKNMLRFVGMSLEPANDKDYAQLSEKFENGE